MPAADAARAVAYSPESRMDMSILGEVNNVQQTKQEPFQNSYVQRYTLVWLN